VRLEAAKADHEIVKAAAGAFLEAVKVAEDTFKSAPFQKLYRAIQDTDRARALATDLVMSLVSGDGFYGFAKSLIESEDKKIQKAIDDLTAMQSENSAYQKAVRQAQDILRRNGPKLEKEIAEADEAIKRLDEDAELARLTRDYYYQLKLHDDVKNMIEGMQAGLETLKESWKDGMHALEGVVDEIQKKIAAVFHINRIEVGVHTHALVKDEPLMFTFIGTVGDKDFDIKAEWLPAKALKDLYKDVTNEILKIA
jgi:chaperonin cofactor prefoldin